MKTHNVLDTLHFLLKNGRLPPVVLLEGSYLKTHDFLQQWQKICACRDFSACGFCDGCLLLASDNHPDIIVIQPHQLGHPIKIEQVRELQQQCMHTPQVMSMMVVIIECADSLNEFAANALLKLFEEPTGRVYFILSAETINRLPKTILSRCWQFKIQDGFPLDMTFAVQDLVDGNPRKELLENYPQWLQLIQGYTQKQKDVSQIVAYFEPYPLDDVLWFLQFYTLKIMEFLQSNQVIKSTEWMTAIALPTEVWWQFWDALIQLRKQLRVQSSVQVNLQLTRLFLILHGFK